MKLRLQHERATGSWNVLRGVRECSKAIGGVWAGQHRGTEGESVDISAGV